MCPNSVKPVWKNDLALYGDTDTWIYTNRKPKTRPRNVIINYESLWRTNLLSLGWDSVIFDESHRLSNFRTKLFDYCYKHLRELCGARVILLSGTPCPEGYHQVIAQSIIAHGSYDGKIDPWEALRDDWTYDEDRYKWLPNIGTEAKARGILHGIGVSMTQKEAGISTRKMYRVIPVELSKAELVAYTAYMRDVSPSGAQFALSLQSFASGRNMAGEITKSSKLDAIVEYVKELNRPCIIMANFTASLEYLRDQLVKRGINVGLIYGDDSGANYRGKVIDGFNADRIQVIVSQVAVAKVGLNLSHSDTLIFAENSYSGEARIQAEERCTVRGKEAVEIVDFYATSPECDDPIGMIDLSIRSAVINKKDFNASSLLK